MDDEIRIINPNIHNLGIKFCNPFGKLKRNTSILRSIFEWMTGGEKVYKNTKTGLILYNNTELETAGTGRNFRVLGINFRGKRITEPDNENDLNLNFIPNFKEYDEFISSLKLAAKEIGKGMER